MSRVGREEIARLDMSAKLHIVILVATIALAHLAAAGEVQRPDKVLGSDIVIGRLIGYQEGDYAHITVRSERGNELSFFVDDEICFLASNRNDVLTVEYVKVERYFPEGGGYFPANIIRSIETKDGTKRWVQSSASNRATIGINECARTLRTAFLGGNKK